MGLASITVQPLNREHRRDAFRCGTSALDHYLHAQARQDATRRIAAPFLATDPVGRVLGFYTLSAASILLTDVPDALARRLPRYPSVPATLLGRLATDLSVRGLGLGRFLLVDAMLRALRSEIASFAFVVDARDDAAQRFYERESFVPLQGTPRRLMRRMQDIASLLNDVA